jgi:hypothetical protein
MLMPHPISRPSEYGHFMTEGCGEAVTPRWSEPSPEEVRRKPASQVLTPEEAIALAEKLGRRGIVQLSPLMDGIAPGEAWKMLRLFETKVLPYLP